MSKFIELKEGIHTIVDDSVFEWASKVNWGYDGNYAVWQSRKRKENKRITIKLHREIIGALPGQEVDHINGNKLDNRRENLRLCNRSQNQANKPLQKNNTSGYKGVSYHKEKKKWIAGIGHMRSYIILGYFDDPVEAAKAYDNKAIEIYGEFALTNFVNE